MTLRDRAPVRLKLAVLAPPCTLLVILAALAVKLAGKLSVKLPVKVLGPALPIVMVKLVVVPAAMLALATLLAMLAPTGGDHARGRARDGVPPALGSAWRCWCRRPRPWPSLQVDAHQWPQQDGDAARDRGARRAQVGGAGPFARCS